MKKTSSCEEGVLILNFFHWCDPIPDVHPVRIDVVGLQWLQTGFQCLHHALAVITRPDWDRCRTSVGLCRGQYDTLAMAPE